MTPGRRPAGHLGAAAAGVHLLSWCAVGVLADTAAFNAGSAYTGWIDAAWLVALVFLLASAALFLGVLLGVIRPRQPRDRRRRPGKAAAAINPPAAGSAPAPVRRAR